MLQSWYNSDIVGREKTRATASKRQTKSRATIVSNKHETSNTEGKGGVSKKW